MMGGGFAGGGDGEVGGGEERFRRLKAEITTHPMFEQLLGAHVACLRVATPIDQLPLIDAMLSQANHLLRSYAAASNHPHISPLETQELDNFLV